MNYSFDHVEQLGGVYEKYCIDDSRSDDWYIFRNDFIDTLERDIGIDWDEDMEVADWHHEVMRLWVYVYKNKFYSTDFLDRVVEILSRHGDCLVSLECYDDEQSYIGNFFLYPGGKIEIDDFSIKAGIASKIGYK